MKIACFDCFAGITGNMILGALINLGLDIEVLRSELSKLDITNWDLMERKKLRRYGCLMAKKLKLMKLF